MKHYLPWASSNGLML